GHHRGCGGRVGRRPGALGRGMRRPAPRPLAVAVEALAGRLTPGTLLGEVQRVWERSVGPLVAREAEPIAEREGVLEVLCSSAVWMQEIDLMGPALVGALNRELGADRVRRVRCVATRGRRPGPDD
ncbi:MAG: DUF721 domain-containing protein, partial [Actinomycetota bacterium]|nr:DUF721 domain-containing protein [Actinomycetota bacterium]